MSGQVRNDDQLAQFENQSGDLTTIVGQIIAVAFGHALKALGCDFIDVTSGGLDPRQTITIGPGYQVPFAAEVRAQVDIPVWADFVAMARAMMYNPRWAWHAAQALGVDTAYSPMYARCQPRVWQGR